MQEFEVLSHQTCLHFSKSDIDALDFAKKNTLNITILGEGTNVVLNQRISGLVLKIDIKGKNFTAEGANIIIEVGAGENWPSLVDWT